MFLNIPNLKIDDYYPELNFGKLLKTLLYKRGLRMDEIQDFLYSQNLDLVDSSKIYGMEKAVRVIEERIKKGGKIIIHGDFDVDGVCATTILFDYLYYKRGADVFPIIPNRIDEGYGLSEKTIQKAIDLGGKLIITVDCGIKDTELVEKYKKQIDFIITDHHQFKTDVNGKILLPKAKAVVHSAHPKSKYPTMISGGATAWQLVRELDKNRTVILRQTQDDNLQSKIDVNEYLDLVAISTVCDIIPLTSENRKLVQKGLKAFAITNRPGLKKLIEVTSIDLNKIDTYHFGFVIGPRLNAPGRVLGDAMDSVRLLVTKKTEQASELALKLHNLNLRRQEITKEYLELAEKQVDSKKKAIVIIGEGWPEGILGLIAGKLAEKHFKPTFIASIGEKDNITGSSRSPLDNFILVDALEAAKEHLIRFGGHKQAAGFASNKAIFTGFDVKVLKYINSITEDNDFIKKINIDLKIEDFSYLDIDDIGELRLLEPYGNSNQKPIFLFPNVRICNTKLFGKEANHIMIEFEKDGKILTGKIFNFDPNMKPDLDSIKDIVGCIGINEWNGRKSIEVEIKHIQ